MVEVSAIEAVINLAQFDSGLNTVTSGQIDIQHRFGQNAGDWLLDSMALVLTPVLGFPQLFVEVQRQTFEARCYGDTAFDADKVYKKLVDFTRHNERRVVDVSDGKALVYWVVMRDQPRFLLDEEVRPNGGMPVYLASIEAEVAEETVI